MKTLMTVAVALVLMTGGSTAALAQGKSAEAPGQDRTCLVQSKNGSFNDVDVASAKWLPRKAAEAQAAKDPTNLRTFEYANDPLVLDGTYDSAEDLCNTHFNQ
jgi:hypothetical protein